MTEFSRPLALSDLGNAPIQRRITANDAERSALATRFGLRALDRLDATLSIRRTADGAELTGGFEAALTQGCVVSDCDVPVTLTEPLHLRFSRRADPSGEEYELLESDLDVLPIDGEVIDLGEAVAQSLVVALDPYPRASEADLAAARAKLMSEEEAAAERERDRARANPFRVIEGGGGR